MKVSSIFQFFKKELQSEKSFQRAVRNITGYQVNNTQLYRQAFRQASCCARKEERALVSNERLEYLGDAILSAIVADYLFKAFPLKNEGFLTEIRSRLVNRERLNQIASKLDLSSLLETNRKAANTNSSVLGNALEALIGALYIDQGYKRTQKCVLKRLILPHTDLKALIENDLNFKSKLMQWVQANGKKAYFVISEKTKNAQQHEFVAQLLIDSEICSLGFGLSKKKAEQDAAQKGCMILSIK